MTGEESFYLASDVGEELRRAADDRARSDARIADLESAIRVYARHRSNCMVHFDQSCSCGWEQKSRELMESEQK
jgi:hypothetical protein